jgi:WhiB family redox-sensing transcriptional regulator
MTMHAIGKPDQDGNQKAQTDVLDAMECDWMAVGNCNNHPPSVFFPSDGVGVEIAKKICSTCPVQERCLEYALGQRIDHGVWGGTSERQRRRILKARRILADSLAD